MTARGKTVRQLHEETRIRVNNLGTAVTDVKVMWECEFKELLKSDPVLKRRVYGYEVRESNVIGFNNN